MNNKLIQIFKFLSPHNNSNNSKCYTHTYTTHKHISIHRVTDKKIMILFVSSQFHDCEYFPNGWRIYAQEHRYVIYVYYIIIPNKNLHIYLSMCCVVCVCVVFCSI